MSINDDLIALVDQRLRLHDKAERAMGTVVTRDTTGPGATVVFDGTTTPMPVKVLGTVFCQPDNRVTLDRYGSDWVVTGSFSAAGFGEAYRQFDALGSTTGNLTSSTFVDLTEFGTISSFVKYHDNTFVRIGLQPTARSDATFTQAGFAVRLSAINGGIGYTPTDITMGKLYFGAASVYESTYTSHRVVGIPAGEYSVTTRWRRISGTGNVTADSNCSFSLELQETVRSITPIL